MITDARTNSLRFGWIVPGTLAGCRRPEDEADYRLLQKEGIRTVVSLLEYSRLPHFAPDFGFRHAHLAIDDGRPPKLHQLEKFIEIVRSEGPACVHCLAGIGRTGCMLTGYLVRSEGMVPFDAIRRVEKSRVYAFQTSEQEDWIYQLIPRTLPSPQTDSSPVASQAGAGQGTEPGV